MKFVALYREYLRGVKQFIDWPPAVGDLICTIQYVNTWICYYFYLISFVLSLFIWFFDDMRKKRERKGEKKVFLCFFLHTPRFCWRLVAGHVVARWPPPPPPLWQRVLSFFPSLSLSLGNWYDWSPERHVAQDYIHLLGKLQRGKKKRGVHFLIMLAILLRNWEW